jgi:lysophospholipase L1-like esterase
LKASAWIFGGLGAAIGLGVVAAVMTHRKRSSSVGALPTLLVGDSLAVGLASPLKMAGLPIHSIGVEGTTVEYWVNQGRPRLLQELATKPGGVLISLGTNDAFNGDTYASKATASTRQLLELLTAAGVSVFWVSPPSLPSSYGGKSPSQAVLNAIKAAVQASPDATWVDSSIWTLERSADHLHPTGAGYSHWADLIVDQLATDYVSPGDDAFQGDAFSGDQSEPSPRPPPPAIVVIPPGWERLSPKTIPYQVANHLTRFATTILVQRRPLGDIQSIELEGKQFGAMTDLHFDDHVGGTWKWHRGMTLVRKVP